jgi:hypothetical protein
LALVAVPAAWFIFSSSRQPTPTSLASAPVVPVSLTAQGGRFTWIENPDGPKARLVSVDNGQVKPVDSADALPSYWADDHRIIWAARQGGQWNIWIAENGGARRSLWSTPNTIYSVFVDGGKIYFATESPSPIKGGVALPAVANTVQITSIPENGGTPAVHATLLENHGKILGVAGGQMIVAAYRKTVPGNTALYRINLTNGAAKRVAGETGNISSVLTKDGALYWAADSHDASPVGIATAVYRLGKDDRAEALTDWLPPRGHLVVTPRGVLYIDGMSISNVWPIGDRTVLPKPLPLPTGYVAQTVTSTDIVLKQTGTGGTANILARIPLQ